MNPDISIIIRSKNDEHFIGKTLKAVFGQEIDLSFEVILVDSGSTDSTLEIAGSFDVSIYEIEPSSFTYGFALNYGKSHAKGRYLINLSQHCIPVDPKWMMNLLQPLRENPAIVATFGRQEPISGVNPYEEIDLIQSFIPDRNGEVLVVFSNSNCAIRKNIWDKYPFDEKATHAEDFIWAKTLPAEYKIKYVHEASVFHSHPLSLKYWGKRFYNSGVFEEYLENVYGLKLPWEVVKKTKAGIIASALLECQTFISDFLYMAIFLLRRNYYRHTLILPLFIALRRYYYSKGRKDGEKLYGVTTGIKE